MEQRVALTRMSQSHLGKNVLCYTDQLFGAVDSKGNRPNFEPKHNYQRTREERMLCIGKGEVQYPLYLGKLLLLPRNGADKQVLITSGL